MRRILSVSVAVALLGVMAAAQGDTQTLIYFIDTEGGMSTLIVSPTNGILGTKEVLLLDAGNLNPPGRDAERIVEAMKDAGVERVDTLVVSHYHGDHVGGVAALFDKVPVRRVLDPGAFVPEQNGTREAGYLSYLPVRQHAHVTTPRPGSKIPVAGLDVHVVSSAGDLIATALPGVRRAANPLCAAAQRRAQDNTPNNFESIGVLVEFGRFRYLDLADLTWNQEMELACPANLLGTVSVYRTSRHGTDWAGAQALVHAVRPRVAVMNNNPTKGGTPGTFQIVKSAPGLEDFWQLHFSDNVAREVNSADSFIANYTEKDAGHYLKLTARSDGSFTMRNGRNGFTKDYRAQAVVTSSR